MKSLHENSFNMWINYYPHSAIAEYTLLNNQMVYSIFFESCRLLQEMKVRCFHIIFDTGSNLLLISNDTVL